MRTSTLFIVMLLFAAMGLAGLSHPPQRQDTQSFVASAQHIPPMVATVQVKQSAFAPDLSSQINVSRSSAANPIEPLNRPEVNAVARSGSYYSRQPERRDGLPISRNLRTVQRE